MRATEASKQPPVQVGYDVADEDDMYVSRSPSSARRYKQPVQHDTLDDPMILKGAIMQRRRSSLAAQAGNSVASKAVSAPLKRVRRHYRRFPLLAVGLGMLVMALLVLGSTAFSNWWQVHQDDMQYGRPRTFQLDAVVGHADSRANPTHLIFLNLNRHVEIIELPGGDASHAHIYQGPVLFGPGQDLTPITGQLRDVNGDGKPDMIVHIQDQQLILLNDVTQFRPQQPTDHVNT
ncbi:MAG: hypothetical protein ACJ788_21560 [Ktedonobacteraceae bacterium]